MQFKALLLTFTFGIFLVHSDGNLFKKMEIIQVIKRTYPRWGQTRIKPDPGIKKLTEWFSRGALPSRRRLTPRSGDMASRREYRTLTDKERQKFHDCLTKMKQTPAVDGYANHSEYETFVLHHTFDFSPEAHESPSFLIFHRIFIYLFERLMRSHSGCHDVGLPYWDPTMDTFLPDPSKTVMFSHQDYFGNGKGEVTSGFLKDWGEVVPPYCLKVGTRLTRDLCTDPDQIITDEIINRFISCGRYKDCVTPKNRDFEDFHGLIHGCVGGHMIDLSCAPNDPTFFLYHCFIDYVFQEYLNRRYPDLGDDSTDPSEDYPQAVEKPYHVATEPLRPFNNYKIIDGLSRNFSRLFVRYEPRPFRCSSDADCGGDRSRALWCDINRSRCKARIAINGECSGLPDNACYPDCPVNQVAVCSTKTVTCQCETRVCGSDFDCVDAGGGEGQLCDPKTLKCQSRLYVGQYCGHLPDKFCSGGCVRNYESPRCVLGLCTCEVRTMGCSKSSDCPQGLWCSQGRCVKKAPVGESCKDAEVEKCGGFESGSECPVGFVSNCSPKQVCQCRIKDDDDDDAEQFHQKTELSVKRESTTASNLGDDLEVGPSRPAEPTVPMKTDKNESVASSCTKDSDCADEDHLCVIKRSKHGTERKSKTCNKIRCLDQTTCERLGLKGTVCKDFVCRRRPNAG